jgi:AcrR family transcriptional regulator
MTLGQAQVDRTARRRAATRQEILAAAWETARADGWEGLTLRRVAERVGMRAPSLYSHFGSKAAIVDAMFGAAWQELDELMERLEGELPDDPRAALLVVARTNFEFFTSDPVRHALMNLTPIPGFTPSEEAYAPAVRNLDRLRRLLDRLGIGGAEAVDLWTALISGLSNQQIVNDPGGNRWARLVPRVVEMYADQLGLSRSSESRPVPSRRST